MYFRHGMQSLMDLVVKQAIDTIGCKRESFLELRELLYEADCISIQNLNSELRIGKTRSGMGTFYVLQFENKLNEKQKSQFEENYSNYIVDDYNVLEFQGGAVGCIPAEEKP